MDLVPYAVPFFFVAILFEFAWGRAQGNDTYRLNDTINSLSLGVLSTATKLLGLNLAGPVFGAVAAHLAPMQLPPASPWTWLFALLVFDFCYYWFHRISHERALFWASHVVHHQSEEFNLSTALRQTSTGFLVAWVFYIPCFLLGVPAEVFVTVGSAHLLYQFWIHSRHIPKLGVLEWFLVTASNHRVHHARNPRYVDKNYGGLLIVWDRLFGTFEEEREDESCVYGITTPLRSWNPVWANLHVYRGMLVDAAHAGSLAGALRVLVARTGWHPGGGSGATPAAVGPFQRFDPPAPGPIRVYVALQFVCAVVFSLWLEQVAVSAERALLWSLYACLALWLTGLGALLEGSRRGVLMEVLRLLALVFPLAGFVTSTPPALACGVYVCVSGWWLLRIWRHIGNGEGGRTGQWPGATTEKNQERA